MRGNRKTTELRVLAGSLVLGAAVGGLFGAGDRDSALDEVLASQAGVNSPSLPPWDRGAGSPID